MKKTQITRGLRGSTALSALVLAGTLFALPAFAQDAASPTDAPATTAVQDEEETQGDIVVTGSLFRRTDTETPSPVTVLTAESLDQRGINTVQEAIQTLASNNGPALTNSFSANGAFGAGASAVSLRGLTTSSTLVLFDGLRAAYYPLSDDGSRNFVDLNTIPDDIVERIEVLKDGASSTYGADAIAGVVNIITKREFKGIGARAEAGITERGDGANYRLNLTAGHGSIDEDGYNVYMSGFFVKSAAVYNRDRPYPYNSDDQRNICYEGVCGPNNVIDGLDESNAYPGFGEATTNLGSSLYVRPYDGTNTTAAGRYQLLNPTLGCPRGTSYTLTAAELAASAAVPGTVCQEDLTQNYGVITPNIERFGGSARGTVRLGDNSEAYMQFNFQQSSVDYTGLPATIRANAPAGIRFPRYSTSATSGIYGNTVLTLPVFVCAAGVNCATAADARLNPNNPFAAAGQTARLIGRLSNITEYNATRSRVYRVAAGVNGQLSDSWDYRVEATAMHNDLRRTSEGYVYIANLLNAINTGTYNFVNPSLNTQAQIDAIAPANITDSSSDLYQAQASVSGQLFDLPGGPLQIGGGVAIRYEAVDAPSANPDYNGPTQRYFRLNAFGTKGDRTVYSAFAEVNAPIFDQLEVNASGRYDNYSSGQDAFSPKIGAKLKPIRQVAIRGTYSRGFRIPSFAEANALPTSGFVTAAQSIYPDSYLAQYGCTQATFTSCPTYIRQASYGLTSLGTQGLEPEKSRSFTAGIIVEPARNISITVDYFNIKKTNAITTANASPAIAAYYGGQAIPAGYTVIPDNVDPAFAGALPRIAFVESGFVNANTIKSEGIDFTGTASFDIGGVKWTTQADVSYILELSTTFPDGTKETYAGTLGNFNLTAGSGTPKWHGNFQTSLDFGDASLSGNVNWFGGYDLSAEDQNGAGTAGDCGLSSGYTPCRVDDYFTVDLTGNVRVNDKFTFYVNVLNLLDDLPPIDPVTYGAHLYNAVQGGTGILGRSFRAGVKVNF